MGDVSVLRSKLDMAEGLLAEAHTHDNAVERLTDRVDFVVEHSRQRERKQVKEAIQVSSLIEIELYSMCQRTQQYKIM